MRTPDDLAIEVIARFTGNSRGTPIAKKAFIDGVLWERERTGKEEQYQNTLLAQKLTDLQDIHDEQRQKIVTFLRYIEAYPVQYTPGLRAEIENMVNYFSK